MATSKAPRVHRRRDGGGPRKKKPSPHPPAREGWRARTAKIVLLLIVLLYLYMTASQVPSKYSTYGLGGVLVVVPLLILCVFEHAHHMCNGVIELVRLLGLTVCAASRQVWKLATMLNLAGSHILTWCQPVSDFGEKVQKWIEDLFHGKW